MTPEAVICAKRQDKDSISGSERPTLCDMTGRKHLPAVAKSCFLVAQRFCRRIPVSSVSISIWTISPLCRSRSDPVVQWWRSP